MHPYVIYIGIPIILVLSIVTFSFRRKKKYKDGKKVANSEFIENTSYFKWRIVEYRICKVVSVVSLALAMSFLTGALARPYKTSENITEIRNRDIFLCLDTSGSMTEVDLQVCEKMREVVDQKLSENIDFNNMLLLDSNYKIVFIFFYAAIIYHLALIMKYTPIFSLIGIILFLTIYSSN